MLQTSISILQLLVQRFWFKNNLGLLAKRRCYILCSAWFGAQRSPSCRRALILPFFVCAHFFFPPVVHHVVHHRIGKATVAASISQWKREDVERNMSVAEQEAIVTAFRQNIEALRMKGERRRAGSEWRHRRKALQLDSRPMQRCPAAAHPSHASVPAFLPFFLDGFGLDLSQHPDALCSVDLPLELAPPQRRSSAVHLLPPGAATSSAAAAPLFDAQHSGLDAVIQAATA